MISRRSLLKLLGLAPAAPAMAAIAAERGFASSGIAVYGSDAIVTELKPAVWSDYVWLKPAVSTLDPTAIEDPRPLMAIGRGYNDLANRALDEHKAAREEFGDVMALLDEENAPVADEATADNENPSAHDATRLEVVHDFRMSRRPLRSVSLVHRDLMERGLKYGQVEPRGTGA